MELQQVSNVCSSHSWEIAGALLKLYQGGMVMILTGY